MVCRICLAAAALTRQGAYLRCGACRCLFLDPFPAVESNAAFSGEDAAARVEAADVARRGYWRRRVARLERHLPRAPRGELLLEIGCGAGLLLAAATERGWRAAAVEMSPQLAARARRRNPRAAIITADVLQARGLPSDCTAVVALDVIEHVTEPALLLRRCHAALRPQGLLMVQTPNARGLRARVQRQRWEMLLPDQHLHLFAPRALLALLRREGFDVVTWRTVSGTGLERGLTRQAAAIKERLLAALGWGNGTLVIARRRD